MTMIQSYGITTLVALMAMHRVRVSLDHVTEGSLDQATVDAIAACLRHKPKTLDRQISTASPPSCS
jgi:hypothetical protein